MADDILVRDDNGDLAVNTVTSTEANVPYNYDDCFTIDTNGRRALRVVGSGGGDQHNLGYYATQAALEEAYPTAEAGDWAIVGATDTVWIWDTDNSAWVDSDQKGQVTSVNGQTGDVVLDLLPTQTGNAGKFLTTDGTNASWGNTVIDGINYAKSSSGQYDPVKIFNIPNTGCYFSCETPNHRYWLQTGSGAYYIDNTAFWSNNYGSNCGSNGYPWTTVYAKKINRGDFTGADITIPTKGGTMAVINIPATAPELAVADWSSNTQTITVTGVTSSNVVLVSPAPASAADYAAAGIICTAQATDSLTFTCTTVPTNAITLSVVIL